MEPVRPLPIQTKINHSINEIPIEFFSWGSHPDHFKIEMPHRHEFSELLFFTKGGGFHEIDFKDYSITEESIHYIPKSTVHFLKRDQFSSGFTVAFDTKFIELNDIHKIINPLREQPLIMDFKLSKFAQILEQINLLQKQIKQEKSKYQQKRFLLSFELLLFTIAEECKQNLLKEKKNQKTELMRKFEVLVKTHIYLHHNVAWYAKELQISPKSLGNEVKRNFGISAKKYLTQELLYLVKKQLIDTNKSIKEIALDHHYDISLLGKLFKKNVGYTLSDYRSYRSGKND